VNTCIKNLHALKRSWSPCQSSVGDRYIQTPIMHREWEAG